MPTFHQWLMRQKRRDSPLGDLARDAERDSTFPIAANSFLSLKTYFSGRGACAGAKNALARAWKSYKSSERKLRITLDS